MRSSVTAMLLLVCLLVSQAPLTAQAQTAQPATVTIPAGTVVPLTLVNPIKNKSSKPGDLVRAVVAFPVTVGTQLAIPAGTYVEGTLLAPAPKVKHQPDPGVQIHFTRLLFANGYSASLDATQTASLAPPPATSPQSGTMALAASFGSFDPVNLWRSISFSLPTFASGWQSWLMTGQAVPPNTLPEPTLPKAGPSPGLLFGIAGGITAATIIAAILLRHHTGTSDFIVHDAGWQFQMKLVTPITLDTIRIAQKIP